MMTTKTAPARSRRDYVTAGLASMMGTTIEWYDFFLYGTAAALIFNKIFFPSFDPLTGTLAAFATYSVGFFARPLGGVIFGHYGDRIGRKSMLLITLLLMGVPTILIGLIPSYEQIGYWAAVLLVLMRFLQGIAVGGEWGGAVLMAVEHAPQGKKGFFGSLPQAGVAPGLILSSLAMGAVAGLPEQDMLSWGWRLPFLASVVLLAVGWFIRVKVAESPDFEQMRDKGAKVEVPVAAVLRHHRRALWTVVGARLAEVTWFYTVVTFSLAYATGTLGIPRAVMLDATIWGAALALFSMPLFGMLGDRIGHKWVFMAGAVGILACAPLFFQLLATGQTGWIIVAVCLAVGLVYACLYGPEGTLFSSQFPAEVRYTGISLAVQVSGAIGGGLAPIVATWLLARAGGDPKYVVWYLSALGVVAVFSAWRMRGDAPAQAALGVPAGART
ncbi:MULTISPECIES: MFS transporter [Achromobacter]|jgi:MHS family shikimate/dehydroshikimate transporter-like MFS transporter|uniref:MFS transporter n=1 Tax=Alcaligenes xylosoxydans xylosoxydans TaxID=85698 RepID=A0A9X3L1S9_ALCXX|nr:MULTISPECIES: MFS transporter [Achromobacter]AMH07543.1 MFS transporter [Achromobacter xylosoxidans]MCZ8404277.1 MFS transporter [Achromobacter xylosoxidans]NYS15278.1 MHS family MFS transporter [Achromobacter xylosoxidans]OFQ44967.1 transporter [Achromobacter xylosoxidans]PWY49801.1 MFS transporter [Achromobacter sp. RW408]